MVKFGTEKKMIDVKRFGYLLVLALVIGLGLVFLRTSHKQTINEVTGLTEQAKQLRRVLNEQQAEISFKMQSPDWVRPKVDELQLPLCFEGQQLGPEDDGQTVASY